MPGINSSFSNLNSKKSFSVFFGVDNLILNSNKDSFLVYVGSFKVNSLNSNMFSLFLPTAIFTETVGTFLNLEGRVRKSKQAVVPFKYIFTNKEIILGFFIIRWRLLSYNFSYIFNFYKVLAFFSNIIDYKCIFILNKEWFKNRLSSFGVTLINNKLEKDLFIKSFFNLFNFNFKVKFVFNSLFHRVVNNYYSTDIFTQNSRILSICALKTYKNKFSIKKIFS